MNLYRFDDGVGKEIKNYGSINLLLVPLLHNIDSDTHIVCMHLNKGGRVGLHQAATPQLFLVIGGSGWVKGREDQKVPISQGQIAFWEKEEWHETTSEDGLVAIVIEGENINPNQFLKKVKMGE